MFPTSSGLIPPSTVDCALVTCGWSAGSKAPNGGKLYFYLPFPTRFSSSSSTRGCPRALYMAGQHASYESGNLSSDAKHTCQLGVSTTTEVTGTKTTNKQKSSCNIATWANWLEQSEKPSLPLTWHKKEGYLESLGSGPNLVPDPDSFGFLKRLVGFPCWRSHHQEPPFCLG